MFIKSVRQHFPTARKSDEEERDWVRSLAYLLRDYLPSELAEAAETIITTRETPRFPLPAECKKACEHAREVMRRRRNVITVTDAKAPAMEPGILRSWREDEAWRGKMRAKGVPLNEEKIAEKLRQQERGPFGEEWRRNQR